MIKNKKIAQIKLDKVGIEKVAKLLLICQAIKQANISIPDRPLVTKDKFDLLYYGCSQAGGISFSQIYEELKSKEAM